MDPERQEVCGPTTSLRSSQECLLVNYYSQSTFFSAEDSRWQISRHLSLNPNERRSRILRRLQDACFRDLLKKANHALRRTRNCVTIWLYSSSITRVVTRVRVTYIELGCPGNKSLFRNFKSLPKWNKRRWITKQHEIRPLRTVLPRKT